jgi:site-specific recombinase XerD
MSYSINAILNGNKDKNGFQKIIIQVIYNRVKAYRPTSFKVHQSNFDKEVKNLPNRALINLSIKNTINEIESRLLAFMASKKEIDKVTLKELVTGEKTKMGTFKEFVDYLIEQYKGKFSDGTLRQYKVTQNKIETFKAGVLISEIDLSFCQRFESHLRGLKLDGNTVQNNCKALKGMLNKAAELSIIDKSQFEKFKVPRYEQKVPEYLTEDEVDKIYNFCCLVEKQGLKSAGFYFLLSCYTGFRISDAMAFDYKTMVKDGAILIRAKKNRQIVSIPIYPKLERVLEWVKDNPIELTEPKVREAVKQICGFVGIKKHVKFHTARHSFAIMLRNKGFDREETSELLGDSKEVAKIYDRITNDYLSKKIKDKLG